MGLSIGLSRLVSYMLHTAGAHANRDAEATIKFEERGFGKSIDGFVMVDGLVDIMEARHSHHLYNAAAIFINHSGRDIAHATYR